MNSKINRSCNLIIGIIILFTITCGCNKDEDDESLNPHYAWVVGSMDSTNYGMILFTPDGGETWQRQGEGSPALLGIDLQNVWAVDSNTVWVVGNGNSILRSTDGGDTWSRINVTFQSPGDLNSISLAGNDNIWISGSNGNVCSSTDGGNTWTVYDTSLFHSGMMQGIHAVSANTVYVAGGIPDSIGNLMGFIIRTIDGGLTWDTIVPEDNYNRFEWIGVTSPDDDNIIVYGGKSRYVHSTDGGLSWINDSVPGTGGMDGADINCLTMLDAQTWWGAFDYDGIFITENGGGSWTKQTSAGPGGMWAVGIDYYDRELCLIVSCSSSSFTGKILKTSNGGELWEMKLITNAWLNKVSFIRN